MTSTESEPQTHNKTEVQNEPQNEAQNENMPNNEPGLTLVPFEDGGWAVVEESVVPKVMFAGLFQTAHELLKSL